MSKMKHYPRRKTKLPPDVVLLCMILETKTLSIAILLCGCCMHRKFPKLAHVGNFCRNLFLSLKSTSSRATHTHKSFCSTGLPTIRSRSQTRVVKVTHLKRQLYCEDSPHSHPLFQSAAPLCVAVLSVVVLSACLLASLLVAALGVGGSARCWRQR